MVRGCRLICDNSYDYHFYPQYEGVFLKKQTPYERFSYCSDCGYWLKIPTYQRFLVACTPNSKYYDINGKEKPVHVLIPTKQFRFNVVCPCCQGVCRGKPYGKDKRKSTDRRRARQENTIPYSKKLELIDDTIRRLKIQLEYENDPSLRPDNDTIAKKVGTVQTFMRGDIEKTLEDVLKLKAEYLRPRQSTKTKRATSNKTKEISSYEEEESVFDNVPEEEYIL